LQGKSILPLARNILVKAQRIFYGTSSHLFSNTIIAIVFSLHRTVAASAGVDQKLNPHTKRFAISIFN
jgi:hypothetical protein